MNNNLTLIPRFQTLPLELFYKHILPHLTADVRVEFGYKIYYPLDSSKYDCMHSLIEQMEDQFTLDSFEPYECVLIFKWWKLPDVPKKSIWLIKEIPVEGDVLVYKYEVTSPTEICIVHENTFV